MPEYQYDVSLITPLGERRGTMSFVRQGENVSGTLTLLKTPQDFTGKLEADGQCHIQGCLQSLVKIQTFTADGYINVSGLNLTLHLLHRDLRLTGNTKGGDPDGIR